MATRAKPVIELTPGLDLFCVGGQCRRVGQGDRVILGRGQCGLAAQFKGQHAGLGLASHDVFSGTSRHQRKGAAPAGHECDVLFAIDFVGHRRGDDPGVGRRLPQQFARIGAVRGYTAVSGALKYQVARGGQGPSIPGGGIVDRPGGLLLNRIPGQQLAVELLANGL